jgi:hypothetical protein
MLGVNTALRQGLPPSDVARVAGWVRDYHRWYWFEPNRDAYDFHWTENNSAPHSLDGWYSGLKAEGLGVVVAVEFAPGWATGTGTITGLPYKSGDGSRPADYAEHAEYMAQIAARWGRTAYSNDDPRIEPPDRVTGLSCVDYLESYNEPDAWWTSPTFPASKYAKMLEADYNGNDVPTSPSTPLVGVKSADPTMGVLHGGLTSSDPSYLDSMLSALAPNQQPFDVVSFHTYMNGTPAAGGKSPEAGGLVGAIDRMKSWRDAHAPDKPVWLTEIGWDTYSYGGRRSKSWAPEASAANYLLRTLALSAANGLDRLFFYMYMDPSRDSLENYQSAGLVRNSPDGNGEKKAGWFYLATALELLGDYNFEAIEADGEGNPAVYSYRFRHAVGSDRISMVWARNPNSERDDGTTTGSHRLYTPEARTATLIEPTKGEPTGTRTSLRVMEPGTPSAYVTLPSLSEKPLFVQYRQTDEPDASLPAAEGGTAPDPAIAAETVPDPAVEGAAQPVPSQRPALRPNLAANPGMELDSNHDGRPDDWEVPAWQQKLVAIAPDPHSGQSSLRISSTSGRDSCTVQQDILTQQGAYSFQAWVKVPTLAAPSTFFVGVQPLNRWGGTIGGILQAGEVGTSRTADWEARSCAVQLPPGTAKARILIKADQLNGTLFVDDVSLATDGPSPPQ